MGYTHYWQFHEEIPVNEWAAFMEDIGLLIEAAAENGLVLHICNEVEDENAVYHDGATYEELGIIQVARPREAEARWLRIEGGYETFFMDGESTVWTFCKTAHREYDCLVVAVLLLAKMRFTTRFTINSDGCEDQFERGARLALNTNYKKLVLSVAMLEHSRTKDGQQPFNYNP